MPADRNQGEGDRDADRRYREDVRRFIAAGQVAPAARKAVDETVDGPYPTFWGPAQHTAWERVKDAIERDWVQTKADLGLPGGVDLEQTARDTVRQIAGQRQPPPEARVEWTRGRAAIRLGHASAITWPELRTWNDDLDAKIRLEWEAMRTGIPWEVARPLARHGWLQGRRDVAPTVVV